MKQHIDALKRRLNRWNPWALRNIVNSQSKFISEMTERYATIYKQNLELHKENCEKRKCIETLESELQSKESELRSKETAIDSHGHLSKLNDRQITVVGNNILHIFDDMFDNCVEAKRHFDAYTHKDGRVHPCYRRKNTDAIRETWFQLLNQAFTYHEFFTRIYYAFNEAVHERENNE